MRQGTSFLISFLVILLDQITKYIARQSIAPLESIGVLPFLHLVSVRNEGAAFGMFKGLGNAAFIIISLAALAFVFFLLVRNLEERLPLSLILGGAAGNLIDRIVFGKVTDFIDVFAGRFHWPAFNIADSALTIGIFFMLVKSLLSVRKRQAV